MTCVSSKHLIGFDSSSVAFLQSATDLGEVINILSGGVRPAPNRVPRLCASLRAVQSYLIDGGRERSRFEAVDDAPSEKLIGADVDAFLKGVEHV